MFDPEHYQRMIEKLVPIGQEARMSGELANLPSEMVMVNGKLVPANPVRKIISEAELELLRITFNQTDSG